jgi:hypothetical protein
MMRGQAFLNLWRRSLLEASQFYLLLRVTYGVPEEHAYRIAKAWGLDLLLAASEELA